jgi:hypothetical protein
MPVFDQKIRIGLPYNLKIASNGAAAVTLILIRRDRISEVEALTTPVDRVDTLATGTARVLMFVTLQSNTGADVVIQHNGLETKKTIAEDTVFSLETTA